MVFDSNSTTRRLEGFARASGIKLGVLCDKSNTAGVYFCVRLGGEILNRWISLGWTRAEAEDTISRLVQSDCCTCGGGGCPECGCEDENN